MIIFAISTCSNGIRGAPGIRASAACRPPVLLNTRTRGWAGCPGRTVKGSQADLQHISVTEHRGRGSGGVGVGRNVVGRQHEAVVHVPGADDILVDLVRYEIPTGGSGH